MRRIMVHPNAHPTLIASLVVHPIGAHVIFGKVVDLHVFRIAFGSPFPPLVLVVSNLLLLLGVNGDYRLPATLKTPHFAIEMFELSISVRMTAALARLTVGLQAIAQCIQQSGHRPVTGLMALALQLLGQFTDALARPSQRDCGSPRVAGSRSLSKSTNSDG